MPRFSPVATSSHASAGPRHRRLPRRRWPTRRCAWRCRRASSTSAAKKRRATFARPQVLLAVMAGCTPSGTGPKGSGGSPQRIDRLAASLAAGVRRIGLRGRRRAVLRHRCAWSSDAGGCASCCARRGPADQRAGLRRRRRAASVGVSIEETTTSTMSRDLLAVFNGGPVPVTPAELARPSTAFADRTCAGQTPFSRTPSSTATTRRRRCCATSGGSRRRISRSRRR